jgi:AraC family transcriptional regulator
MAMNDDTRKRLERAILQIDINIDRNKSLDELSKDAGFSKFHFHRLFSGFTGVSIGQYLRFAVLKRAAFQLAFRKWQTITDIAFDAGYENAESFSRAFKREYGQTPSNFRKSPDWHTWHKLHETINELSGQGMKSISHENIEIINFPETKIAVYEHYGPPHTLKNSITKFIEWRRAKKLPPHKHATYNILYDDPTITADDEYRFDLCCAVSRDLSDPDHGIVMKSIPAGKCAKIRHTGPDHLLDDKVRYLIGDWFTVSNEALRDFPIFFERVSFFPDVPEREMITDIYLPLE